VPEPETLIETSLPEFPKRFGKVRDVYDMGDCLLLVATDRISAFDWILPTGIPDKGRVLTGLSEFWFDFLKVPDHRISSDIDDRLAIKLRLTEKVRELLTGRTMIVRKARVIPFECVVRGYLSGSAWKEYKDSGEVCGIKLPEGLVESDRIEPIFTPATKAESGHDMNVSFETMAEAVGQELAETLRDRSLEVYNRAVEYASGRGLILADTKFEWGIDQTTGGLMLIDEVLTPDSSRYWDASLYKPGGPQASFDKQFVRDWLESVGWDKASPAPFLPDDVVAKTRLKYIDAYEKLTGRSFPWA